MQDSLRAAQHEAQRILIDLMIKPPVSINDLMEYAQLEYFGKYYNLDVDGYYFRTRDGKGHVVTNCNPHKPIGRVRFTACHEIYHHILAANEPGMVYCMDSAATRFTFKERMCDRFAAEVLMPSEPFCEWWNDLRHNREYREQILMERFGVTIQALRIREQELGLRQ